MRLIIAMEHPAMSISQDERAFFAAIGSRIAQLRKNSHITQTQLSETLGVSQPTINTYETGVRRIPVSALPRLAKALGVSLEGLIGEPVGTAKKRGPAPKLQQHMERISQLPRPRQRFVMQVLAQAAKGEGHDHRANQSARPVGAGSQAGRAAV